MTPKEKAEELVKRYRKEILKGKYRIDGFVVEELSEECVLIAVDEIIAQIEPSVSMDVISARIKYWEQVKQEIEKL